MDVLGSALILGEWVTEKISIGLDLLPFLISSCCDFSMVDVVRLVICLPLVRMIEG